jgi:hypothetical protein
MKEETDSLSITELVWTVFICAFCAIIHEKFLTLSLYVHTGQIFCTLWTYSTIFVRINGQGYFISFL